MTPEAFTEKIRKDVKTTKRVSIVCIVGLSVFLVTTVISNFIGYGLVDTLIYMALLVVAEIPAAFIFYATDLGYKEKKKLLEICDEEGITIPEYLEREGYDEE